MPALRVFVLVFLYPEHLPAAKRLEFYAQHREPRAWRQKYHADGRKIHRYTKLMWPREAGLESWGVRLGQAAVDHQRTFVAVSNHFEGYAPHTAQRLGARVGLSLTMPDSAASDEKALSDDGQLDLL